jgi:hypothetical protein
MIVCGLSPLLAQFCYIIVCAWQVQILVDIPDWCTAWKFSDGVEKLVLQALQL